jgi:integrase
MTRRRSSGEDSIYRDGDRWRGAVSLGYDEHGNRVRKKVSGRTRAEVIEKLRKLRQQVDNGVIPDDRLTVRAFLDRWLTVNVPGTVAESTEDGYAVQVRLHLAPALGRKRLAQLTVADLDKLWKAKRDAGYSSNSIRLMRTVLRRAIGQAVREGIVSRNVAGLSTAPHVRAKEGRTLTVDQAQLLLEAAARYRFEAAVLLALAYGMRRGEVLGLHWSALDWKAGTLRVTHGVKRVKDRDASSSRRTRLVVSELKTPKSRRLLALTPEMVARFRQHRARQAEAQIAAGASWQDHGLIFASEVGTPMDPDNFSHSFARLCEQSGLGTGIRTSCATRERR